MKVASRSGTGGIGPGDGNCSGGIVGDDGGFKSVKTRRDAADTRLRIHQDYFRVEIDDKLIRGYILVAGIDMDFR